jgi:dihydroorotase (multifunctional complex type)
MTTCELVVANGMVISHDCAFRGSIGIRDGKIIALADKGQILDGEEVIDAQGHIVMPGVVDAHVHLRDPGLTHKEDFATGTRAAAKGGVTTVADMPNTNPPITTTERFVHKRDGVAEKAYVDYALWAGATDPDELEGFADAGAAGYKVYMAGPQKREPHEWTGSESPYSPELLVDDDAILLGIFREAARLHLPVVVHLGNQALKVHAQSTWWGKSLSEIETEYRNLSPLEKVEPATRCVMFAKETGVHLHIAHAPGTVIPVLTQAKRDGIQVTAESLCPFMPFELLDTLGVFGFDRYMSQAEIEVLWDALRRGIVDMIATDHAPHTYKEKKAGETDIMNCPSGYPELETELAMMYEEGTKRGLSLPKLAKLMCMHPAQLLGIDDRKGAIAIGLDADLVIFDPDREWIIRNEDLETKCGWSPFHGRNVRGWPRITILRGKIVMREGEVLGEPGTGQLLRPSSTAAVAW